MKLFSSLLLLAGFAAQTRAKSVFAHFMVGNTAEFTWDDWVYQMSTAAGAGIDAFALNVAFDDATNDVALPLAFDAAESFGFKLFFSLDYAGNGAWPKDVVSKLVSKYTSSSAYWKRGSQPLVSTFEGPGSADDWKTLKGDLGAFFIPDYSSLGAQKAMELDVADGLFSWDSWPKGDQVMTTYSDASYYQFLGGKPYMMPASPWFYTNLPGYNKNWLWRGDDTWFLRWQEIISIDHPPEFIEIISWNDFGESHYIGPLDNRQYEAFDTGRAPFNFVLDMPHDGWREHLPYYISMYKTGTAVVEEESAVVWYRINPKSACNDGGTTGDTSTQLNLEHSPADLLTDAVYVSALLTSEADATVSIGGVSQAVKWDYKPDGGVGVYHGSVSLNGATGSVVVSVKRSGSEFLSVAGKAITTSCSEGQYNNYNAWVGVDRKSASKAASPPKNLEALNCTRGFGVYEFAEICKWTCGLGYCPSSACVCTAMGVADEPEYVPVDGYPAAGQTMILQGLCSFACNTGYCPSELCSTTPNEGSVPTFSPFLPPACRLGTGSGALKGLCEFSCNYGFCPMHVCSCTQTGLLIDAPPLTGKTGRFADSNINDYGLCNFAVSHGWTPDVCVESGAGGGSGNGPTITLDPIVWQQPTAQCEPPCVLVLPPITLGEPTTIQLPPITTSLEVGGIVDGTFTATTVKTVITPPAVTTTKIGLSNVVVTTTTSGVADPIIYPSISVSPPPFTITPSSIPGAPFSPTPREIHPAPWPYGAQPTTSPTTSGSDTTTTIFPIPLYFPTADPTPVTTFPLQTVSWITNWVSEPTTTNINGNPEPVIPCWVWFIWVCPPNFGGIVLSGWLPGIYPRGGPPGIGPGPPPPGVTLPKITWPKITIRPDRVPVYPTTPDPNEELCKTATAEVCTTTVSYGIVAKRDVPEATPTPAPRVPFEEFADVKKRATTTTTTTISFCTKVQGCGATDISRTTTQQSVATTWPRIVIPSDPNNAAGVRASIAQQNVAIDYESSSTYLGTVFFYLHTCTDNQAAAIRAAGGVADIYVPRGPQTMEYHTVVNIPSEGVVPMGYEYLAEEALNETAMMFEKRGTVGYQDKLIDLDLLQISWPPGNGAMGMSGGGKSFSYDDSLGEGTYVYSCDYGVNPEHDELAGLGAAIQPLYPGPFPLSSDYFENDPKRHGTKCLARMVGKNLGLAKKARVSATVVDFDVSYYEHFLDGLAKIHDDIKVRGRGKMAVVNLSISIKKDWITDAYKAVMARLIQAIISEGGVFVTGSGNDPGLPSGYPALFGDPADANHIPDLIIVGSVQVDGSTFVQHAEADYVTVYAPGTGMILPNPQSGDSAYGRSGGTSYAGATVAGLAAYIRGKAPGSFDTAAAVKTEILRLAYVRKRTPGVPDVARFDHKCIWNGQSGDNSEVGGGSGSGGGGVAVPPVATPITFSTGSPQPTCTSGSACGTACVGYFCASSNFTHNPDFEDPQNPDSVQNPKGPNYGNWDGTKPLVTQTSTGSPSQPTAGNPSASKIPDCLVAYVITDTSQTTNKRGTIDGNIIYKGLSVCGGTNWCDDYRSYGGVLPPVCRGGTFSCSNGYSASATQKTSRGTLSGWFGIKFKADDMSEEIYFEVPQTDNDVKACKDTLGSAIGDGNCKEERFGAYFGGSCANDPLWNSWKNNGLIKELSKTDAVATHPIDSSVTG